MQTTQTSIWTKDWCKNIITITLVFVLLLIVLYPMAFQNKRPGGVDVIGSYGKTHQLKEYEETTGKTAYWNPPVFSGMPIYHRLNGQVFNFDKFIGKILGTITYPIIWIYLIGFIGMFFLLKFFKLGLIPALIGGLGFIFIPHYMSLLNIGHFAKFRPIMYMPIVTFFFISFLNKKNLLWLLGFIFAFTVQIRTQHYQILFYQLLILLFLGIFYLIKILKAGEKKKFFLKIALIIVSSIFIILLVAQPLFVINEYTPYSIRGGTGEKESTGLSLDYSTRWSFHPSELLTFVMPRFFGGTSGEIYTGTKAQQLQGRQIPGYWGHMPFTQAYDYVGIIIIFFAIIGLILNFKNSFIKTLLGLFLLSLLLSLGRHFPLIYNLFFQNIPYFNKFRVPAMILVIMQFIIIIWAAYGLKSLINLGKKSTNKKKLQKTILVVASVLIILGLIPMLFGSSFSLQKSNEAEQYKPQVISLIRTARLDMMQTDGFRLILFTVLTAAISMLFINKKLNKNIFAILIIALLLIDLIPYVKKAEGDLYDMEKLEKRHFQKTNADKILLQDKTYYRIFPVTENPFNNNDWSYYHNSIGGYSAAKLRIYQDIIENCLQRNPFNWNVHKMLNVKYFVGTKQLPPENLEPYYYDKQDQILIYKTKIKPKPAWFVSDTLIVNNRDKRFQIINSTSFDPYKTAILEKKVELDLQAPDSSLVEVKNASFNQMEYNVYTDKPALLVTSEIYYPPGWKCFVDGKETEIYKADHILRSIHIDEPGEHNVLFKFSSKTFNRNYLISLITHIVAYVLLVAAIVITLLNKKRDNNE